MFISIFWIFKFIFQKYIKKLLVLNPLRWATPLGSKCVWFNLIILFYIILIKIFLAINNENIFGYFFIITKIKTYLIFWLLSYLIFISFIWFDNITITIPIIILITQAISKHNTIIFIFGIDCQTNSIRRYINIIC